MDRFVVGDQPLEDPHLAVNELVNCTTLLPSIEDVFYDGPPFSPLSVNLPPSTQPGPLSQIQSLTSLEEGSTIDNSSFLCEPITATTANIPATGTRQLTGPTAPQSSSCPDFPGVAHNSNYSYGDVGTRFEHMHPSVHTHEGCLDELQSPDMQLGDMWHTCEYGPMYGLPLHSSALLQQQQSQLVGHMAGTSQHHLHASVATSYDVDMSRPFGSVLSDLASFPTNIVPTTSTQHHGAPQICYKPAEQHLG